MKPLHQMLAFRMDDRKFALSVSTVKRVIRVVEITGLPKAPEIVSGIINLQGQIISVFNIRLRFNLPAREVRLDDQMIIASPANRTVALLVDSVDDVFEIPESHIIAGENILPSLEYLEGVVKTQDGMILIHDLESFLSTEEEKSLDDALEAFKRNDRA